MFMEQSLYLQNLFLYRTEDGKGVFEEIEQKSINIFENYKERAPTVFGKADSVGYVKEILTILKNNIQETEMCDEEACSSMNDDWYKNFIETRVNYIVELLCTSIAENFFEKLGNGNMEKGLKTFEEVFLEDRSNYNKLYKKSSEFRDFCDSMSDKNKKQFKSIRNFDFSSIFKLHFQILKWSFIIGFWFFSIPYYVIKKIVHKYKGFQRESNIFESQEIREIFFVLSKTSIYR